VALSADAVAGYLDLLEAQGRSQATVRKERAALNRLVRHLELIGATAATPPCTSFSALSNRTPRSSPAVRTR
jgi:hypothetical protein